MECVKETDSVRSLDDLQDVEMFDHKIGHAG